jgi:hypothetical protein
MPDRMIGSAWLRYDANKLTCATEPYPTQQPPAPINLPRRSSLLSPASSPRIKSPGLAHPARSLPVQPLSVVPDLTLRFLAPREVFVFSRCGGG